MLVQVIGMLMMIYNVIQIPNIHPHVQDIQHNNQQLILQLMSMTMDMLKKNMTMVIQKKNTIMKIPLNIFKSFIHKNMQTILFFLQSQTIFLKNLYGQIRQKNIFLLMIQYTLQKKNFLKLQKTCQFLKKKYQSFYQTLKSMTQNMWFNWKNLYYKKQKECF